MKPNWIPLVLALTASAHAQDANKRPDRQPPPVPPLIAALDLDKDRKLSADEITVAAGSLAALDANGDGEITRDELRPPRPDGAPGAEPKDRPDGPPPGEGRDGKPPRPPVMAALDSDGDGTLSADEIAAAPESLRTLDKDGDGSLDRKELMPPPPHRDGGQGGRDGRPQGPPPGDGPRGDQGKRPNGPQPGGPRR